MLKKWAEKGEMRLKLGFKRILRVLEVGGSMSRDSFKKSENRQKVVGGYQDLSIFGRIFDIKSAESQETLVKNRVILRVS